MSPRNSAGGDLDDWVPPKNTRWTVNDGRSVAAAMVKSGLSRNAFARKYGLPVHRVKYWVERLQAQSKLSTPSPTPVFVPVELEPAKPALKKSTVTETDSAQSFSITLAGIWHVVLPARLPESKLKSLLRCLKEVAS